MQRQSYVMSHNTVGLANTHSAYIKQINVIKTRLTYCRTFTITHFKIAHVHYYMLYSMNTFYF